MKLYEQYLDEAVRATNDKAIARTLEQKFGVKIKNLKVRKIVEFTLKDPLDEEDMSQWDTIDNITDFLKKTYGTSDVEIDWKNIKVEQQ